MLVLWHAGSNSVDTLGLTYVDSADQSFKSTDASMERQQADLRQWFPAVEARGTPIRGDRMLRLLSPHGVHCDAPTGRGGGAPGVRGAGLACALVAARAEGPADVVQDCVSLSPAPPPAVVPRILWQRNRRAEAPPASNPVLSLSLSCALALSLSLLPLSRALDRPRAADYTRRYPTRMIKELMADGQSFEMFLGGCAESVYVLAPG